MTAPVLAARGLRAGFGPTTVLHGVDLDIDEGELVCVLGLNGAGKSVTLKVVGGLVAAWDGSVHLHGEDVTKASVESRVAKGMGFVPQGRQLFPDLTVAENLRLGGFLPRRRDRAGSDVLLAEMLERFPRLAERQDQMAGTMSGGEQAMLALARALMSKPRLLLVDEPSAGLSPKVAAEVFALLAEIHRDGMAMLLIEQNVHLALGVADHAYVMQGGRVVYDSPVASLDHARLASELGIGRLLAARNVAVVPAVSTNGSKATNGTAPARRRAPLQAKRKKAAR